MKGDHKRKATNKGLQKGKTYYKRIKTDNTDEIELPRSIERVCKDKYDFIVSKTDNGLLYELGEDALDIKKCTLPPINGEIKDFTALRPKKTPELPENQGLRNDISDDSDTNIIVLRDKMCSMWNDSFKEHKSKRPRCGGDLFWDEIRSKQWGLSWKAVLSCTNCDYYSQEYRLYNEVQTGNRGPKPAATTYGLQVGLSKQGISNGGITEVLTSTNIKAPSYNTLQRAANYVGKVITETNMEDLERQIDRIKDLCVATGFHPYGPIPAEADGTYNNGIFTKVGKTPFQAGTQVDFTVSENLTSDKKIIAIVHHSKLCSCPKREGKDHLVDCTATLPKNASIGNEGDYLEEAIEKINESNLVIGDLTVDGDSSSRATAPTINQPHGLKITPKYCTIHLKWISEKRIKGHAFSPGMFKGRNKLERDQAKARFTYDISNRMAAEFEKAHERYGGNIYEINGIMPHIMDAIIDCYKGNCKKCDEFSYVCNKTDGRWNRPFLDISNTTSRDIIADASEEDIDFLRSIMQIRLGTEALESTSNNSTQNKSEANNRGIKKAKPKQITYPRNSAMRTHSAAHSMNNGVGTSILTLCAATGCPIGGVSVYRVAIRLDSKKKYHQRRQKAMPYKLSRRRRRQENYKLWDERREDQRPGYIKDDGQDLIPVAQPPP